MQSDVTKTNESSFRLSYNKVHCTNFDQKWLLFSRFEGIISNIFKVKVSFSETNSHQISYLICYDYNWFAAQKKEKCCNFYQHQNYPQIFQSIDFKCFFFCFVSALLYTAHSNIRGCSQGEFQGFWNPPLTPWSFNVLVFGATSRQFGSSPPLLKMLLRCPWTWHLIDRWNDLKCWQQICMSNLTASNQFPPPKSPLIFLISQGNEVEWIN